MSNPSGVQNPFNVLAEKAPTTWQPLVTWCAMFTYQLPAGKGRRFLNNNRALDYAFGGWQVNGVTDNRTGFPDPIVQSPNYNSSYGYAGQRPNATGVSPVTSGSLEQRLRDYINYAAYSVAPQFTFGNLSRVSTFRGPGLANWDLSLFKTVPIKERLNVQVRIEALNAFNTPEFLGPSNSWNPAGVGSFGQITSQMNTARLMQFAMRIIW
jgi:hypothetical protein